MVAQHVYYVEVKDCLKQLHTTRKWKMKRGDGDIGGEEKVAEWSDRERGREREKEGGRASGDAALSFTLCRSHPLVFRGP